jgi:LmbE family N-acetylglucosaminyl deacetylase
MVNLNFQFQHIYLSPHFDDAVYSCGASIHQQASLGEKVLVFTICAAAAPNIALSPFASSLHARWGAAGAAFDRIAEDSQALQRLGAAQKLGAWPDCIYRQDMATGAWLYPSEQSLFGQLAAGDIAAAQPIALALQQLANANPTARFYVPLAIGNHVDHQLTYHLATRTLPSTRCWFYADYPYAVWPETESQRMALAAVHRPAPTIPLSAADLQAKIAAAADYRSQLSSFWHDEAALASAFWQYSQPDPTQPAQEFFYLPSSNAR